MINESFVSNIVVLSDMIKASLFELEECFITNIKFAELSLNNRKMGLEAARRNDAINKKTLNILVLCSFFLEALINSFGLSDLESSSPSEVMEKFEGFVSQPTINKWKKYLKNDTALIEKIGEIIEFRNYFVHSKPVDIRDGSSTVFKKHHGWLKVTDLSPYLADLQLGLLLEGLSPEHLERALSTVNESVQKVNVLSPNYTRHYRLEVEYDGVVQAYKKYLLDFADLGQQLQIKK